MPRRRMIGAEAAALAIALTLAFLAAGAPAAAHGGDGDPNVRAVVDPLPPALAGMRVELHRTVAPQIVLGNATTHTVEVLDPSGVPFLRIGPRGVEGNLAAASWYETFAPGAPVPASLAGASKPARDPRWVRASDERAFGWFDPRLDGAHVAVPHLLSDRGLAADLARWQIRLRVDGKPSAITGRFRWQPPPRGTLSSRLLSPADVAPGVRVKLLPGRVPGLLLESSSAEPIVVLGEGNEPFLRIAPDGVDGNRCSPTFQASGRRASGFDTRGCSTAPVWERLASTPRVSWIEPRAALDPRAPTALDLGRGEGSSGQRDRRDALAREWRIPLRLGESSLAVVGVTTWSPASTADRAARRF